MDKNELEGRIHQVFRLRPRPHRRDDPGSAEDDGWSLSAFDDLRATLENCRTGARLELRLDQLRSFQEPDFLQLDCQVTVGEGVLAEPLAGDTTPCAASEPKWIAERENIVMLAGVAFTALVSALGYGAIVAGVAAALAAPIFWGLGHLMFGSRSSPSAAIRPPASAEAKPARKRRSPWVYGLMGCCGVAVLVVATCGYVAREVWAGVADSKAIEVKARKLLGEFPAGYSPTAALNFFGQAETAVLSDAVPDGEGGFLPGSATHTFMYIRAKARPQNAATRAFLTSNSTDTSALWPVSIYIDAEGILKRGHVVVDARQISYVTSRGQLDTGETRGGGVSWTTADGGPARNGLTTVLLFDCPGEELHVGAWAMEDPSPVTPNSKLELSGTVADEVQLAKFLQPMRPCPGGPPP